ncbi:hypothetical protein C4J65_02165 [Streptomyces sp. CB09001]|nr:hypothetical protein C4J65_02165 [Streptomyces sp. CB09001]
MTAPAAISAIRPRRVSRIALLGPFGLLGPLRLVGLLRLLLGPLALLALRVLRDGVFICMRAR